MSQPTPLFDTALIRARLARARRAGYASFLLERALDDLDDRLGSVLRRFPLALDLATPLPALAHRLRANGAVETVLRLSPLPERGAIPLAVGDPERLPFGGDEKRFNLIVSVLALQQVNDLPGALVQIRRALQPDGLFLACLLGAGTLDELRRSFLAAESEIEGGASPRVAPFAEVRDLGALLQRAGFALPVADTDLVTVRYPDPFALMRDLQAMGWSNALHERRRVPLRRATLLRAAEIYTERFSDPDGRIRASFALTWLLGWAPHDSQQKPLKPGSAKARLADALGVPEQVLGPEGGRP